MQQPMRCPRCEGVALAAVMTKQGVQVDRCPSCNGLWLDRGEVFHFTQRPALLAAAMKKAQAEAAAGGLTSPKTGKPMSRISLLGMELDYCPDTGGLWLDKGELTVVAAADEAKLRLALDPREAASGPPDEAHRATLARMGQAFGALPNLALRSGSTLILLYALLAALLIFCVEVAGLPAEAAVGIGVIIVVLQFLLGPFIMDLSLRWFYGCHWVERGELPPHLERFIAGVMEQRKLPFPRMGLIEDGSPNAFTYGHTPRNARIVLTRGLLTLLDEGEVEAVAAHEIGHAVHWDMLVMTMAQLVPLVAYYIFRTLIRIRSRGRDKSAAPRLAIALAAYVVYVISEYVVLWLSRVREYWADRFAGEVTGKPELLAAALVKIGYGLAGRGQAQEPAERKHSFDAVGALSIFDGRSARGLAIASGPPAAAGAVDRGNLVAAMRWDMWNPWAKWYELNSTHPLVANRLLHLSRQSAHMGQEPYIVFDERRPESYWDEFFVDLLMMALPALGFLAGLAVAAVTQDPRYVWMGVSAAGLGMLVKTLWSYPMRAFPDSSVVGLLKNVKVSAIRGIPCRLRGRVIGRGVPGLIWSEDFVMQDDTGIMFLDYRQPWRIWEFLFGLLRRGEWAGREVEAEGWYRRAPVPYVELKRIASGGDTRRCYVFHVKLVFALILLVAPLLAIA